MNGKAVVISMVVLVGAVLALAFWWPEGKEEVVEPVPAPAAEEQTPKPAMRVVDRAADGTVTMSNLPEGAEDPVAAAKARAAERAAERAAGVGEDNPFEGFVDDGTPLTADAMDLPSMLEMEGGEPEYDAVQEARQRFHSYENEILENAPLDPETWKDITRNHQEDIKGVFKRSKVLVDGGHNEKARVLIEEWTELQNKYKAQAYGRSPQAFTEPDQ